MFQRRSWKTKTRNVVLCAQRAFITADRRRKTKMIILVTLCLFLVFFRPNHMEHLVWEDSRQHVPENPANLSRRRSHRFASTPTARPNHKMACFPVRYGCNERQALLHPPMQSMSFPRCETITAAYCIPSYGAGGYKLKAVVNDTNSSTGSEKHRCAFGFASPSTTVPGRNKTDCM